LKKVFGTKKAFGSNKNWVQTNFEEEKNFSQKISVKKEIWFNKFWVTKDFGLLEILGQMYFWSKNIFEKF